MGDTLANSLLKISNLPALSQFLHDCVDDLTNTKKSNFDNYNSDIEWTVEDFESTKKSIQKLFRQSIIDDKVPLTTSPSSDLIKAIQDCYQIRKNDVFQALVTEKLVESGHNLVVNYDWKLKWIVGSSKLSSLNEPVLQVDLNYLSGSSEEGVRKNVNFEANLEKLDLMIEQLEKAVLQN